MPYWLAADAGGIDVPGMSPDGDEPGSGEVDDIGGEVVDDGSEVVDDGGVVGVVTGGVVVSGIGGARRSQADNEKAAAQTASNGATVRRVEV